MEKIFKLKKYGTNVKTEIFAGITTFMTLAYILAVNPSILGDCGLDKGSVFTATVISSAIATILMGLMANLPFALSAAMGPNAYFAYTVVLGMGYSHSLAFAAVFIEGIIFIILSITNVRTAIVSAIPNSIKLAVGCGIGLFITLIGLKNAGIVVDNASSLIAITSFKVWNAHTCAALLCIIGVIITTILMYKKVFGNILIGILLTWIIGIIFELTGLYVPAPEEGLYSVIPSGIVSAPQSMAPTFMTFTNGFKEAFSVQGGFINFIIVVLAFLFVDFFDTLGTLIGCAETGNMLDEKHELRGMKGALLSDAIGTVVGAVCGTSTISTYVESATGISEGGRTGLTAIVVAILFIISLFLSPIFLTIPSFATSPALIIVGFLMIKPIVGVKFDDVSVAIPAFLTLIAMPFFYSISEGISIGIITYTIINLFTGNAKKINIILYPLAIFLALKYVVL